MKDTTRIWSWPFYMCRVQSNAGLRKEGKRIDSRGTSYIRQGTSLRSYRGTMLRVPRGSYFEEPRLHAWSMCAACFPSFYFPVTCNPSKAVTLPNIRVPHFI